MNKTTLLLSQLGLCKRLRTPVDDNFASLFNTIRYAKNSVQLSITALTKMNVEELKCRFGFREPDRGLDKEDVDKVIWRFGKMPDYTIANRSFLLGKTHNHKAGK